MQGGLRAALFFLLASTMNPQDFVLRGEHITLDALLKASGLAGSGGEAKQQIMAGAVQVNAEVETRRGRKLRAGDRVELDGQQVRLHAGTA